MNLQLTGTLPGATTNPAPPIECYLPPAAQRNGTGLIILPGGGYRMLAEHEGKGYADYFVQAGISCFVVTYRLGGNGHRHPAMLEDALAAVHTVRGRAAEWGIDPAKIGIMGSSAGGHLTAHTLVANSRYAENGSLRPDFGILCYPVIRMRGDFVHEGCRANLLGDNPSEALIDEVAVDALVTAETPPCFLWHTVEDAAVPVENSMIFAGQLRKHGVPFELHIYPKGRHGLGLNTELAWGEACLRWIRETTAG
ncbi:MAG: alpha/beta hydrolase [Caldilineaceae bacterium]|nr:alpha/beta hydrolase [Caldilineaceae bacterium]